MVGDKGSTLRGNKDPTLGGVISYKNKSRTYFDLSNL